MEKLEVISEKVYQEIKKEMNKNDDYFTLKEMEQFTNIYNTLGEFQAN